MTLSITSLKKVITNRTFINVVITGLFVGLIIVFIHNEHLDTELVKSTMSKANVAWIVLGLIVTIVYILLEGLLYVVSFQAIGADINLTSATRLFLKRNFVGTFLPAGTFTSLAFFGDELKVKGLQRSQIHYGSFLFLLASLISVVLIAIPAIVVLLFRHQLRSTEIIGLATLCILVCLLVYTGYSLIRQTGLPFRIASIISPSFAAGLLELRAHPFRISRFIAACATSLLIELVGVLHLYIAMAALGIHPSIEAALIGYVIMVIILSVSPLLHGLGAIEVALSFVMILYGYSAVMAASITLIFRMFEFWLPLLLSGGAFLVRKGNLVLRLFPAVLILALGIVNMYSAFTPAISARLVLLRDYLPISLIRFSTPTVAMIGIGLILLSWFLFIGARYAWWIAVGLSISSLILHLTKALDYEEASLALITAATLLYTRKTYFVRYKALFRLRKRKITKQVTDTRDATDIVRNFGNSSLDYFKTYHDKRFYFNDTRDSFISFATSQHYAIVLEGAVGPNMDARRDLVLNFERYCSKQGLGIFYYRVIPEDLRLYSPKQYLPIGEEAIVDLTEFSLDGSNKKSMRNAVNKIERNGFLFKTYLPPLSEDLIQQIKSVSDEWLDLHGHSESGFSQGYFLPVELINCEVLAVESGEGKILAFANVIPSYKNGESTYDLIRHVRNGPNGLLDFLIVKMIAYFRQKGFKTLNMGLAPLALVNPETMNEKIIEFYRENFKQAARLRGLYEYKKKFEPRWETRYLVYDQTFDLLRFPMVLRNVSRVK
ncbi:MAG: phosphatidylglycerol lysyltransferase domain-containing protein [Bacteroidota bacterium]